MLAQSAVNEVDIIFFAWLGCPDSSFAQAALLPCLLLLWMFGGSLSAISVGTQALAARRFAEGHKLDAGTVLANSWVFSLLAGVVFTLFGYLVIPHVLGVLVQSPEVRAVATSYLNYRLLGITSMAVTFSFKAFFDGIGKTHVHMVASVIMNVLNVLLCITFIFGRFGAPRMGMAGAGLAGALASWIGLLVMVAWAGLDHYRKHYQPFNLKGLSREILARILRLSVPSAIATIAVMSGFMLFSMIVSRLDSMMHTHLVAAECPGGKREAVNGAATMVIVGVLKLTFTACLAFGTSTATLVSQCLGAGKADEAEKFGWTSVKLGLLIFGVVGLLEGVILTEPILHLVTKSHSVFHAARMPMRMMGLATPLIAVGMILTQALFGAGNTRFVMFVELILHFCCLVPLAWLLGITFGFGLVGIWSAALVYVVLLTAVMVFKFKSGDWKTIKL